jgi:mannose/fructose-specific phosphotransferase system component IIA
MSLSSIAGTAVFSGLAVDMIIRLVSYLNDRNTADEINAHLQQERKRRKQEEKS